jgi:hypothetical protein
MVRLPGGADAPGEFRNDHVSRAVLSAANAPCFSFPGGAVGQVVSNGSVDCQTRSSRPTLACTVAKRSGTDMFGARRAGLSWEWEALERGPDLRVVGGAMVDAADERDEGRKIGPTSATAGSVTAFFASGGSLDRARHD